MYIISMYSQHLRVRIVSCAIITLTMCVTNAFIPSSLSSSYYVSSMHKVQTQIQLLMKSDISYSEESLKKFKVVELKAILSDIPADKRKGSSKTLTRKADLVKFLVEFYSSESVNNIIEVLPETIASDDSQTKKNKVSKSSAKVRCMPSLPADEISNQEVDASETSSIKKSVVEQHNNDIFEKYPPLNPNLYENQVVPDFKGVGSDDIRADFHPMMKPLKGKNSDFDVVFVGTASCIPSHTRGVSCTALRLNWNKDGRSGAKSKSEDEKVGGTWLFDAGECTQLQIQNVPALKLSKITKVFLTHCHGDHTFGLPGLLCLMGQAAVEKSRSEKSSHVIDIYGPQGLRLWLRIAIRYSQSRICPKYRVHELMDVPMAPEWKQSRFGRYFFNDQGVKKEDWRSSVIHTMRNTKSDVGNWINYCAVDEDDFISYDRSYGEVPGGHQIYPNYKHPRSVDGAPIYEIIDDDEVVVTAAPMSHGVPCVGYVVHEQPRSGRIKPDLVQPVVQRNFKQLKELGMKHPMKVLAEIKGLDPGQSYTFPDGSVINRDDVVEEDRMGRKVVICGDTCDARALEKLGEGADVLIHECTNSFLRGIDRQTTMKHVNFDATRHGHSTPQVAGNFAKKIGAKKLLLNHFSARYRGDQSLDSIKIMTRIERQAIEASGLSEENVACSWDFMELPIVNLS